MDTMRFDAITRLLGDGLNRRDAMRRMLMGGAALAAGGAVAVNGADAKRRRKNKKKKKGLPSGARCTRDEQCRPEKTNRICDVPQNASNSDTVCCGAQGATCGGVDEKGDFLEPYCCIGEAGVRSFVCSQNDPNNPGVRGTCIPAPEEP
jgi:hypothetical protein